MARKEVPMTLRRTIVDVDVDGLNVTAFCAQHGVSTWFFWDLRRRYASEGEVVLEPKSRAPRRVANKTPVAIEDLIVAKRKELDDAGLDAGPGSIRWHLSDLEGLPSEATVWRILTARGFIHANPAKAPRSSMRRFTAERANECWQLDDTTWQLADGTEVKIFNVVDDHSRLLIASVAMPTCTGAASLGALGEAAVVLGWPERILSDNAKAFRGVLTDALGELGVAARHSRPHHPQTNGKVERFHQTLKKWLDRQPRARSLEELQAQLDTFRYIYNHQRPHRSIGRRVPAQAWVDAPKSGPADRPLSTPTTVAKSKVRAGQVYAGSYTITVGAAHNGRPALTVITGNHAHVFVNGRLVRELTIDPTRQHQTLYQRRGRPRRQLP
jgi:transposase InsO family protein